MENEERPSLRLTLTDGSEFIATPDNSYLFTFLGQMATNVPNSEYNHVFVCDETTVPPRAFYIFENTPPTAEHKDMFDRMMKYMIRNDYPLTLNHRTISDSDKAAYDQSLSEYVDSFDSIPDDWS